ncbi:MAG: MFS transporter [Bacteroidota bacterium]|jgi:ACS family hexuronate transporter-like MFS transporter
MTPTGEGPVKIGSYRWMICALLFFATTINYLDRNILGLLAPTLQKEIGWTPIQYGYITMAFQAAYAIGLALFGWFIDRYGTKIGYSMSIIGWSFAAMGHALASTVFGFGVARSLLGLSESGNFPAAIKATAEWFPKKERALATGIFNSGANIGAVVAPAVVPWLTVTYGWQASFVFTGAVGFVWLVFWIIFYEKPEHAKKLKKEELNYILSDPIEQVSEKVKWVELLKFRQTWAFVIGKFLTDPIWWFYLYWLALFLNNNFGLTLTGLALPLIVIYMMTSIGSIGFGYLSGAMIKRGMAVNKSRRLAMLICALLVVPVITAASVTDMWLAIMIIGVAAAAHQGWSANIFTTASDMFPKKAVGSVVGLGGFAGSVGGMILLTSSGYIVEGTGSYIPLFIICGSAYLLALGIMTLLLRNAKPVEL